LGLLAQNLPNARAVSVNPASVYGLATFPQAGGTKVMVTCALAAFGHARAIESTARGLASERKEYRMDQTPGVEGSAPSAICDDLHHKRHARHSKRLTYMANGANAFAERALHAAGLERSHQASTRQIVVSVLQLER
jgi:hypothetical protein